MKPRAVALAAALAIATGVVAGCSGRDDSPPAPQARAAFAAADESRSIVQRGPRVRISRASLSPPLSEVPDVPLSVRSEPHPALARDGAWSLLAPPGDDVLLQKWTPPALTPAPSVSFIGQGYTMTPCKPGPNCQITGTPPDTNGAVGKSHYVQTVNGSIAIWDKTGKVLFSSKLFNSVWSGYTCANAGCACATQNDGDPVVLYDWLADRWLVTQFSLPNYGSKSPPSFQCIAVSKTPDPTGAWWRYDYEYGYVINDYGKFGAWTDAYYATYNMFDKSYQGDDFCAYDRAAMLAGQPATEQCFFQPGNNVFGALPTSVDGQIPPPEGEPGLFAMLDQNTAAIDLYTMHVDWAKPANSKLSGPTTLAVSNYTNLCGNSVSCVPQPATNTKLASLGDRLMFRLAYRNFGSHESLTLDHSVAANGTGGIRWYEIQAPAGTPKLAQAATFAPNDGKWRWMGSLAQDMAKDLALGYSVSSGTVHPSIAWTGRLGGDALSTMGQGEATVASGTANETYFRWGDYSAMTLDPSDDCTFWYTQEYMLTTGEFTWDTRVAAFKFPSCGANDFSIGVSPAAQSMLPGTSIGYTVSTKSTLGTPESISLYVQNLPTGVTGGFSPQSVTAGGSSTLTLSAANNAPYTLGPVTFMVIGEAASAVHPATADLSIVGCVAATCASLGDDCGSVGDGCGGTLSCGTCAAHYACQSNKCVCVPDTCGSIGAQCGVASDGCGGSLSCGACGAHQACDATNRCVCAPDTCNGLGFECGTGVDGCGGALNCGGCPNVTDVCTSHKCISTIVDAGSDSGASDSGGSGDASGSGDDGGSNGSGDDGGRSSDGGEENSGGSVGGGGCACTAAPASAPSWPASALGVIALAALRARRRVTSC